MLLLLEGQRRVVEIDTDLLRRLDVQILLVGLLGP
jgi:hypothetical protein